MMSQNGSTIQSEVITITAQEYRRREDRLVTEEPLEIRIIDIENHRQPMHSLTVTMRTPGNDFELAAGFLFCEGIIRRASDISEIAYCRNSQPDEQNNVVKVTLAPHLRFRSDRMSRHVFTSSSCGICGRAALKMVHQAAPFPVTGDFAVSPPLLYSLSERLSLSQPLFACTGGLHAAGLFDTDGELLLLREDVGRHNALDKVIGRLLLDELLPASQRIMMVSGRVGFELVQKTILAGIPMLISVGAPSSLAVKLAREFGMTLVGFLREERFNIYSAPERITGLAPGG